MALHPLKRSVDRLTLAVLFMAVVQTLVLAFTWLLRPDSAAVENAAVNDRIQTSTLSEEPGAPMQSINALPAIIPPSLDSSVTRMFTEWDPVRYVVVSVPLAEVLGDLKKLSFYTELFKKVAPVSDILVLTDQGNPEAFSYFMHFLEGPAGCRDILDRLHLIESTTALKWIRDFGPLYGQGPNGTLVLFDNIYQSDSFGVSSLLADGGEASLYTQRISKMDARCDLVPIYLNAFLSEKTEQPVKLVKTSLLLDGGDVFFDGSGRMFTSFNSLVINGMDRDSFKQAVDHSFGVHDVHFLKALPGETVDHLDMLFKLVAPNIALVPDVSHFSAHLESGPVYRRHLLKEVLKTVEYNNHYLAAKCPDVKLIKVPMPLPVFASREKMISDSLKSVLATLQRRWGMRPASAADGSGGADLSDLEPVVQRVRSEIGQIDLQSESGLSILLRHYLKTDLDSYLQVYAESKTSYRSYINSFFLQTMDGKRSFVVPRYSGRDAAENLELARMEKNVQSVYAAVAGKAEIIWIDSDILTSEQSAIHCVVSGVPYI